MAAGKFSGAVVLTDLNDFINPAQACVVPVKQTRDERAKPVRGGGAAQTACRRRRAG